MKKLFIGVCLVLSGVGAQAQDIFRPLSAGLKAGANFTSIFHKDTPESKSIIGAHAGLVINYKVDKKHAVQAEVLYSGKGFEQPENNIKNTLNYIDLPVLYRYTFFCNKKGGNVSERQRRGNFFVIAGPQLSVLLTSTAKVRQTGLMEEGTAAKTDLYAYTRPFDISAVGGVGYTFKNGLSLDARGTLGVRNIHGSPHILIPGSAINVAAQAGVTYLIPIH